MLPSLPQEMNEFLIKKGPMQPTQSDLPQNQSFPKDKYGRSFQSAWYWKSLSGDILERLLALKYSAITTGAKLFIIFEEVCSKLSVDWTKFLVRQSYDGAQNMRGETNGLGTKFSKK